MRGTTKDAHTYAALAIISIHVPREGDDLFGLLGSNFGYISIHGPREGDDPSHHPP